MNVEEIAKTVPQNVREQIIYVYEINETYKKQFSKHKNESIHYMFDEYHKLFPSQKQDINCTSCRNAVVKLWGLMIKEWKKPIKQKNKKVGTKRK
tara:strand:- start:11523 stop:11807 length:285 start_codon:yes stop_codon:yes gene_type:complete